MKLFSSELGHNYDTYTFGYTNYCVRENTDTLSDIYKAGYLPYSGAKEIKDTFYMARSMRIPLKTFTLSSENRRIAKKFDDMFKKERISFSDFKVTDDFLDFCLSYFATRHGNRAMPHERLLHILNSNFITTIVVYKNEEKVIGYVLETTDTHMAHYWFSFYDLTLVERSLGLWLMLDCMCDAKDRGIEYYYVGTVYGEKSLYKTNFEPLEWWDGSGWNNDTDLLKKLGRSDTTRNLLSTDTWKKDQTLF